MVAENVVMNDPADCAHISQRLGAEPVVMDPADSAFDSRPRLWWMLVYWKEVKHHPPLQGRRFNGPSTPDTDRSAWVWKGWKGAGRFHASPLQHQTAMECLRPPNTS